MKKIKKLYEAVGILLCINIIFMYMAMHTFSNEPEAKIASVINVSVSWAVVFFFSITMLLMFIFFVLIELSSYQVNKKDEKKIRLLKFVLIAVFILLAFQLWMPIILYKTFVSQYLIQWRYMWFLHHTIVDFLNVMLYVILFLYMGCYFFFVRKMEVDIIEKKPLKLKYAILFLPIVVSVIFINHQLKKKLILQADTVFEVSVEGAEHNGCIYFNRNRSEQGEKYFNSFSRKEKENLNKIVGEIVDGRLKYKDESKQCKISNGESISSEMILSSEFKDIIDVHIKNTKFKVKATSLDEYYLKYEDIKGDIQNILIATDKAMEKGLKENTNRNKSKAFERKKVVLIETKNDNEEYRNKSYFRNAGTSELDVYYAVEGKTYYGEDIVYIDYITVKLNKKNIDEKNSMKANYYGSNEKNGDGWKYEVDEIILKKVENKYNDELREITVIEL